MIKPKYTTVYSNIFFKEIKKLSSEHKKMVLKKLGILRENPYYSSLRTKKLEKFGTLYESSVNMDIRIIWEFDDDNRLKIILLRVGHHDIFKDY